MDQNFNIINKFVKSFYNLDREKYFNFISEDCDICYHFNGKFVPSDKKTYTENLIKEYFEYFKNATEVKIISISIINKGEYFETDEICHFTRKSGIYKMMSKGILKIHNNKIVHIQYMFNKEIKI